VAEQKATGLRRIINAGGYSLAGFRACWRHEAAFRQELMGLVPLLPLALYLGRSGVERALLAGSLLLVPLVELLNSAIEAVVDRVGNEHHELSGRAKDVGSAAVFLAIAMVLVIWLLILSPRW
jgi:diacylglycerol kinase (ATP)